MARSAASAAADVSADAVGSPAKTAIKCRFCRNSGIATAVDAIESGKAINPRPAVCIACNGSGDSDNPEPEPLPIWRAYLRRLDREGIQAGGMAAKDRALYPELAELCALRLSVLTAKGRVSVPEQVAKHMLINGGGRHPAGEWTADTGYAEWAMVGHHYAATTAYIIDAINASGNALVLAVG